MVKVTENHPKKKGPSRKGRGVVPDTSLSVSLTDVCGAAVPGTASAVLPAPHPV